MNENGYSTTRLAGKVALVTGASSGIGEAAARALSAQGAAVVLAARRADRLDAIASALREGGVEALAVPADMTRDEDAQALVAAAVERFGGLDIAFNNAGVGSDAASVEDHTPESWAAQLDANLTSVFVAMRHEIPVLKRRGGGVIINNASNFGVRAAAGFAPYVAAKHGVIGLTRAAALELAPENIRVNAIAPGPTDTPMLRASLAATEEGRAALRAAHPLGRIASADEIASLVAYLAGDDASFFTASTLVIDAGWAER